MSPPQRSGPKGTSPLWAVGAVGRLKVEGSTSDLSRFFGYFDPPAEELPNLVVR